PAEELDSIRVSQPERGAVRERRAAREHELRRALEPDLGTGRGTRARVHRDAAARELRELAPLARVHGAHEVAPRAQPLDREPPARVAREQPVCVETRCAALELGEDEGRRGGLPVRSDDARLERAGGLERELAEVALLAGCEAQRAWQGLVPRDLEHELARTR